MCQLATPQQTRRHLGFRPSPNRCPCPQPHTPVLHLPRHLAAVSGSVAQPRSISSCSPFPSGLAVFFIRNFLGVSLSLASGADSWLFFFFRIWDPHRFLPRRSHLRRLCHAISNVVCCLTLQGVIFPGTTAALDGTFMYRSIKLTQHFKRLAWSLRPRGHGAADSLPDARADLLSVRPSSMR